MDEFEQESSRSSKIGQIIGIIVCCILIVGLAYGYIFISHETRIFNSNCVETEKLIHNQEDLLEMQQSEMKSINDEINNNIDTDELTNQMKEEYPVLAKQLENNIINEYTDTKIAYLTFDNILGKHTNELLDILDEYDIKGTFINYSTEEFEDFDEDNLVYLEEKINLLLEDAHAVYNNEEYDIDYNVLPNDDDLYIDENQMISNVIDNTNTRKILAIKLHNYSSNTVNALPYIIEGLQEEGYSFLPLFNESIVIKNKE